MRYLPVGKKSFLAYARREGAWFGSGFLKEKHGWDILPVNAPHDKEDEEFRNLVRIVPTEISVDMTNGGLSFAYEAYWYHKMGILDGLEFKPSYNFHDTKGDKVTLSAWMSILLHTITTLLRLEAVPAVLAMWKESFLSETTPMVSTPT